MKTKKAQFVKKKKKKICISPNLLTKGLKKKETNIQTGSYLRYKQKVNAKKLSTNFPYTKSKGIIYIFLGAPFTKI